MDPSDLVDAVDTGLRARGSPERAAKEQAYLKSAMAHYGVTVPANRAVVRAALAPAGPLGHEDVVAVAGGLWAEPAVFDRRFAAVEVLEQHVDVLDARDLPLCERLLRQAGTWALVDNLAASVVGPIVDRAPEAGAVLDRWVVDEDFWMRRSALLALLLPLRRGDGDPDRFFRYAESLAADREFFVRKAIGWVLRDTARKRPDLVFEWLLPRAGAFAGLTVREAVKPLSPDRRAAVLAART